jgi:hypothetical protein
MTDGGAEVDFKYITDITHFFPDDPDAEMPDEALALREYLGHVIKAATVTAEVEFPSAIPCRKRVNRRLCAGFVKIRRQDLPEPYIFWHCSVCDDGGRIANWRDCPYDQSQFAPDASSEGDEPNPLVEVTISREEMSALLSGGLYDPESDRIIYSARPVKTGIRLHGRYGDMETFEGYVAADANHEESPKRQRVMDDVHEKIERALQKVYDQHDLGAD